MPVVVLVARRAAPSAEFSVDRLRHLVSFLTMLGPSPDWNVGLSGEDLCTKDCGWVREHVADLTPWDAGTDSGVTYEVWTKMVNSELCVCAGAITPVTTFVSNTCGNGKHSPILVLLLHITV